MISQSELGRVLGLSKQAISKLKGQGMPVDSVESAQAWRVARQNVAQRKPAPALVQPPEPSQRIVVNGRPVFGGSGGGFDAPPDTGISEDRDEARTRREIAEANLAELKEAEQSGKVIRADAVRSAWAAKITGTRDALLQIPSRLGPVLAATSDLVEVTALLEAELRQALAELSAEVK